MTIYAQNQRGEKMIIPVGFRYKPIRFPNTIDVGLENYFKLFLRKLTQKILEWIFRHEA